MAIDDPYEGRGIHDLKMYDSLLNGPLRKMLDVVIASGDLDVQIRNNYLIHY